MPLFLLYFIILTNLYCAETLNIALSFVIDVHFVMVLLLVFSKMWQFAYPFGFCNPVRIYRRKINDDDDDHDHHHHKITAKKRNSPICKDSHHKWAAWLVCVFEILAEWRFFTWDSHLGAKCMSEWSVKKCTVLFSKFELLEGWSQKGEAQ